MRETDKYIFFYGGIYSQWYTEKNKLTQKTRPLFKAKILTEGIEREFFSTEQFMMASKAALFQDEIAFDNIMATDDPSKAKQFGREVEGFDVDTWETYAFDIVVSGNYAKFSQNEKLKHRLIATHPKILVEASPYDRIWGIGLAEDDLRADNPDNWRGQNLLGEAIMTARIHLINMEAKAQTWDTHSVALWSNTDLARTLQQFAKRPSLYGIDKDAQQVLDVMRTAAQRLRSETHE